MTGADDPVPAAAASNEAGPAPLLIGASDRVGGAARAMWRLHEGLKAAGCPSRMLVGKKVSADPAVTAFRPAEGLPARLRRVARLERFYRDPMIPAPGPRFETFSTDRSEYGADLLTRAVDLAPDLLNLHWATGLFEDRTFLPAAAKAFPLVWTLHDMHPFTGGCHYDRGCGRFAGAPIAFGGTPGGAPGAPGAPGASGAPGAPGCGRCPQLAGDADRDLSRRVWERRAEAFAAIPTGRLTFVTPSRWLGGEVRRSGLCGRFPTETIPNGLDTNAFQPRDRIVARAALGVPEGAKVVLFLAFGSGNVRKGFDLLRDALGRVRGVPGLFLLTLGGGAEGPPDVPRRELGGIDDDRLLSLVYSAADLFVIPTRADNLPNTVLEAMACGTPSVGFAVGGLPEMIRPNETGLLAAPENVAELADAVAALLTDEALRGRLSETCRRVALAEYSLAVQAERYRALYRRTLAAA